MVDICALVFRMVSFFVPKSKRTIVFYSVPDYGDSSRALFRFLCDNCKQYRLVWIVKTPLGLRSTLLAGYEGYSPYSVKGLWAIMRASMIVSTHLGTLTSLKSRWQKLLVLWHGIPLKAIGLLDRTESPKSLRRGCRLSRQIDAMTSTSPIMRLIMSSAFQVDPRRIHVTGLPRNDRLLILESRQFLVDVLGLSEEESKVIVLYMPTFRTGHDDRTEGAKFSTKQMSNLAVALKEKGITLVARFHPFEEAYAVREVGDSFRVLTTEMLNVRGFDLYDVLGGADIMITDYSSVYLDFMLTRRPVIFALPDYDTYNCIRGFSLEPYDYWTPGPKCRDWRSILTCITEVLQDDTYHSQRKEVMLHLHSYQDSRSCMRTTQLVNILMQGDGNH